MSDWLLVLAGVLLTAGTALFVAGEFSLVALDRPMVEAAAAQGDSGAGSVLISLRRLSTQLSGSQVGITITTLALGFLASPALTSLLTTPLAGVGLTGTALTTAAGLLALILVTLFSMIFGELVPQFLGMSAPLATAKVVALPLRLFTSAAKPFILVLNGSANQVLRRLGIEPQEELSAARSPAELASMVRTSAEAGTLGAGTARLITASIGFGEQSAEDVMTPRSRATAIERTASAADVVALAASTGHSRFPVLGEDWDDIDGIVHLKSAVAVPFERRPDVPVSALMTPALLVPETLPLDPLLRQLRTEGLQIAVVVDEYGGTSGVVTLEDLVEELVGDVSDEHDRAQTTGRQLASGEWSVPGLWRPDEVRSRIGAPVPDDPVYETVGGYLMARLGRVPVTRDEVDLDGWTLRVVDMDGRRVDRIRLIPPRPADEREGGEGA